MAAPRWFDHDAARARFAAGASLKAIAREFGVSDKAVARVVNPRIRKRMDEASRKWHRDNREPCRGHCGQLVWVTTRSSASGYCPSCLAAARVERRDFAPLHGTEGEYSRGCRCDLCRVAASAAKRARRERSRVPCSHGCGRMVDSINRRWPDKPPECRPCAIRRVHHLMAERRAAA